MSQDKDGFEASMARLREIVEKLEGGDLPLEEGVTLFREGVALARSCRERLDKARNEVTILADGVLRDFAPEDGDA
ncbi:exodeoxyribonuclease VII small subunit [Desulfocurvus vexinensis]|uniref:exodeoxyribonuclease VII small subunit n=1 Tax=Desulfocurvus vexinensis TaxID=399548 RepID=UPI0004AE169F|nr:exodeoxyribonuclease VII small subunit [Desulfocurvus vexinensis]